MTSVGRPFLEKEGLLLSEYGFTPDEGYAKLASGTVTYYHYTHADRPDEIFSPDSGLLASRPIACPNIPEQFKDRYVTEGFLEPLPNWLKNCTYFGDLGYELMRRYIGNVLLEIKLPVREYDVHIADYAHVMECKSIEGTPALQFGYDCNSGSEVTQAYVHSFIPVVKYKRGHVAPVVQVLRLGEGVAVPNRYIEVSKLQPFQL
ncbi:hypothetical protein [Paenibacillus apiarius]|uniref:hypothetical protein n=1 Tax=Paenibacillus apiarius TaxID=46240 RepID=UPI003B3B2F7B